MKNLTNITRGIICTVAAVLAVVAVIHNPGHLFTAAIIFAWGLNVEWEDKEDIYE